MDMLVNLCQLPPVEKCPGVHIARALGCDIQKILLFARGFSQGWADECAVALYHQPCNCLIAVAEGKVVGFACYDATCKGFFGPIGVDESLRGKGVGRALLLTTLHEMAHEGYGYAVIGWCDEAQGFYARTVGAIPIPHSAPEESVYGRLIHNLK